jgi:DNA repair ATPase RecN
MDFSYEAFILPSLSGLFGLIWYLSKKSFEQVSEKLENLTISVNALNEKIIAITAQQNFKDVEVKELKNKIHDIHNTNRKTSVRLTKLIEQFKACQATCVKCNIERKDN